MNLNHLCEKIPKQDQRAAHSNTLHSKHTWLSDWPNICWASLVPPDWEATLLDLHKKFSLPGVQTHIPVAQVSARRRTLYVCFLQQCLQRSRVSWNSLLLLLLQCTPWLFSCYRLKGKFLWFALRKGLALLKPKPFPLPLHMARSNICLYYVFPPSMVSSNTHCYQKTPSIFHHSSFSRNSHQCFWGTNPEASKKSGISFQPACICLQVMMTDSTGSHSPAGNTAFYFLHHPPQVIMGTQYLSPTLIA